MAQGEGAFPEVEISQGDSFGLDVPVRPIRGKPLGMTNSGWHAQHRRAAVYVYGTSSCFMARTFPGHCCVGIKMLGDAWRDLLDPKLGIWNNISERR
jgi:hypothetical protein